MNEDTIFLVMIIGLAIFMGIGLWWERKVTSKLPRCTSCGDRLPKHRINDKQCSSCKSFHRNWDLRIEKEREERLFKEQMGDILVELKKLNKK